MSEAPSDLPRWRSPSGNLVELQWTELRPADQEATSPVPQPPDWRPGLKYADPAALDAASPFDSPLMSAEVLADDGVYLINGKEVRGRPRTAPLTWPRDTLWRPEDLAAMEVKAEAILRDHDFPLHLEWPEPGAWAWSDDGRLWWAGAPAHGTLVAEGRDDAGTSALFRGDLGWPIEHPKPDPRAAERWPKWSAFAWAVQVHDAAAWRRQYLAQLAQAIDGAAQAGIEIERAEMRWWPNASTYWAADLARAGHAGEALWRAGFALGAHVAEDRARRLAAEAAGRGVKNGQATHRGGKTRGQQVSQESAAQLAVTLAAAKAHLKNHPTFIVFRDRELSGGREETITREETWTPPRLATALHGVLLKSMRSPPQVSTIAQMVRDWVEAGELSDWTIKLKASPPPS